MVDGMLTINGKQYFIKYDINVLCEMKLGGLDVMKLDGELDFIQLRALFYYGLKKIQRDDVKTQEDAGNLLSTYLETGGKIDELAEVLTNAISKSLGLDLGK
ncbi:hypothetical protein [Turicibacter sanguinis]|uniref:hypothetical protein n=1 Tax=Turicibacter sanguinis TaxID=154288 RepID=UPI0018A8BD3D|nr:hypothetical protein [Turicibacter sanguinis]DAG16326.1 MAG TPA: tail assembly chaperone protein [Caudoviricetes sp.]MDB8567702.1 hypothetical protein [Turicibacter sanguinis]MDB8570469.1 hypothetical protein [Turicibacter sanguinis]MDB8573208.1 hypothetical protein [Turicibacter sanguinis]MDB8581959.1 hypothetical protein [Turicibacter sanguinis]